MKLKVGKFYQTIINIEWDFDEGDEEFLNPPSQDESDCGNWTKEISEYLKQYGTTTNKIIDGYNCSIITLPIGTYLEKIKNKSNNIIDDYQHFKIYGTNIQITLIDNFLDYDEMLKEVDILKKMVMNAT